MTEKISKNNKVFVLKQPRITEKASTMGDQNVYTFNVFPGATKNEIKQAIVEMYKVTPIKIATVTVPAKNVFIRGKKGVKSGGKKAYVYFKKEDKIEII